MAVRLTADYHVIASQSALHCGVIATGNQWILIRCA